MSPKLPSNSSYTAVELFKNSLFVEKLVVSFPLWLYATHNFILSNFPIVSTWLIARPVNPFKRATYFKATKSSQPHLLGLFVVVQYSCPNYLIKSPISLSCSVTYGPAPTLDE